MAAMADWMASTTSVSAAPCAACAACSREAAACDRSADTEAADAACSAADVADASSAAAAAASFSAEAASSTNASTWGDGARGAGGRNDAARCDLPSLCRTGMPLPTRDATVHPMRTDTRRAAAAAQHGNVPAHLLGRLRARHRGRHCLHCRLRLLQRRLNHARIDGRGRLLRHCHGLRSSGSRLLGEGGRSGACKARTAQQRTCRIASPIQY